MLRVLSLNRANKFFHCYKKPEWGVICFAILSVAVEIWSFRRLLDVITIIIVPVIIFKGRQIGCNSPLDLGCQQAHFISVSDQGY